MTERLSKEERDLVVKLLRDAAKLVKARGTGKGDQRLLAAKRKARYTEVNDLATAIERGDKA
jgi:hypothetical protein